jgi:hypothetical protein
VTMTFKRHIAVAAENFSWPSPDYYPMLIMQPIFGNWDRALGSASYLGHNRETQPHQLVRVPLNLYSDTDHWNLRRFLANSYIDCHVVFAQAQRTRYPFLNRQTAHL